MSGVVIKASKLLPKSSTSELLTNLGIVTRSAAVYAGPRSEQAVKREASDKGRQAQKVQYTGSSVTQESAEDQVRREENYAKRQSDAQRKDGFQKLFF